MRAHNGTILMHKTPYDPVKAHEYYMRTRKLKGRKPSSRESVSNKVTRSPTYTVKLEGGQTIKLTERQLAEQRAYAAKRVGEIKKRLEELSSKLRKMVSEAKQREAKSKREAEKKPTAAEKSKAARESKKYREKHKQALATKRKQEAKKVTKEKSKDSVAELEKKITKIKDSLTAAVAKQRALTAATKNS